MRAVFVKQELSVGQNISLTGDQAHHLNVVRTKELEQIKILNGQGFEAIGTVLSISKKEVMISVGEVNFSAKKNNIEVVLACPKKEAFEDILKFCVELGVSKIQPLTSKFSQFTYTPNERFDRLIESAMIQSNNLFCLDISPQISLDEFLDKNKEEFVYFSSIPVDSNFTFLKGQKIKILIGPEGGFSNEETAKILMGTEVKFVHLPTPILRAPTAVATSIGYLLANLK